MNPSSTKADKAKVKAAKDKAHERYVVKTYGLEAGEYARLLAQQDGRCAICMKRAVTRRLAVDHDHETNEVRGLLCFRCNHFLGQWEFDPIVVYNAIEYLRRILAAHPLPEPRLPETQPVETTRRPLVRLQYRKA